MDAPAERGTRRLLKAGTGGLFAAFIAIVACETPLLAALLIGVGAGSAVGQVSGWLDMLAVVLLLVSATFIGAALYRRRRGKS
jgi:hypothetical protein